jgi:hypothetical protein
LPESRHIFRAGRDAHLVRTQKENGAGRSRAVCNR